MGDETKGKMRPNEGEKQRNRRKRSRRLIGLPIVLLLGLMGIGLVAEGLHQDPPLPSRDKDDEGISEEKPKPVQIEQSPNMDLKENKAKLQAVLDNTNAELQRTKEKLEKAAAEAQQKIENPPLDKTRETVANGLGNFRSALFRAHKKLAELNDQSKGKGEQRKKKSDK